MIFRYINNKRSYLNRICIACEQALCLCLEKGLKNPKERERKVSTLPFPLRNFFTPSLNREPVHRLEGISGRGRKPRSIGIFRWKIEGSFPCPLRESLGARLGGRGW